MLFSSFHSQKRTFTSRKSATVPPRLCTPRRAIIAVALLWCCFLAFLQFKYNNNDGGAVSSSTDQASPNWNDPGFDLSSHLQKLSGELDTKTYDRCKKLLSMQQLEHTYPWSQGYQDWFLWNNFFHGRVDGVYLDIGAHKPLHLSNTAFFDKCLGWSGICVEPTETGKLFQGVRSCTLAPHCAWSTTKKLVMVFRSNGDASTIISEREQQRIKKEMPDRVKDLFECNAISGADLLKRYKVRNKRDEEINLAVESTDTQLKRSPDGRIIIDFISLDVEGAEVEFVKCFPFDRYDVRAWVIEINKQQIAIDTILLANGFVKHHYLNFKGNKLDAVYVKKTTDVKLPWRSEREMGEWSRYPRCGEKEQFLMGR